MCTFTFTFTTITNERNREREKVKINAMLNNKKKLTYSLIDHEYIYVCIDIYV